VTPLADAAALRYAPGRDPADRAGRLRARPAPARRTPSPPWGGH